MEISTGTGFVDGGTSFTVVPASWRIAGAGNLTTDKYEDLLWQTSDGQLSEWTSNGYSFDESAWTHASPGVSWLVEGLADFNRDGHADILWRNTDGSVAVWTNYGNGNMFNEAAFYQPGVPTSWHIDAVGDVTSDGKDDIIWRNDDGALSLWQASGAAFDEDVYHAQIDMSWHIAQAADFNGDGRQTCFGVTITALCRPGCPMDRDLIRACTTALRQTAGASSRTPSFCNFGP